MTTVAQRYGDGHRVLVTGGAGFVPSHLVDALLARGCTVVAIDNFVTGSKDNIAHLDDTPHFTLVEADISEGIPEHPALASRFDVIMHFASPASPTDFAVLPIEILRVGSVGTLALLERAQADDARFIMASTSEAYGDPLVHPQPESYWGNVNPNGVRSVYDEAKRFSEAAVMGYHRARGVDVGIVRIFNSILADEFVLYDDGEQLRNEPVQRLAGRIGSTTPLDGYSVPAFGKNGAITSSEATWLVGHPTEAPCFQVRTSYGRTVSVTGDHSLFIRDADGQPQAKPVSALAVGDRIAIGGRVDVPERNRKLVSMIDVARASGEDPWNLAVSWSGLGDLIHARRVELVAQIAKRQRSAERRSAWGSLARWRAAETAPLAALEAVGIGLSAEARVRRYKAGATTWLPVNIEITDDVLWLLGLYVAEGSAVDRRPKTAAIVLSCDDPTLDRAERIIRESFGLGVVRSAASASRAANLCVNSQLLLELWKFLGLCDGTREKNIPGWVLGLPLSRLKWFIEGYREGDGIHSGKKFLEGVRHEFSTVSTQLKNDLVVALGRFGLVPSVGRYETTFKQKTGDRRYPFWRVTLPNVSPWSPLLWDEGVEQRLAAGRHGDLVWAEVLDIQEVPATPLVYDFCVPGKENFWAGTGVLAHNTYGPRMRPDDGRAIPTFVSQALRGEPITVHGTGTQTRSITYVSDLVRGILALLDSTETGPINCGTEHEMTMRQLAETIVTLTGSSSEIIFTARGADDPEKRRPDLTLARAKLGYEPEVGPEEGLNATIDYFRSRLG